MRFEADGLPKGLTIDEQTGRIRGTLDRPGEHLLALRALNALGDARRELRIVVGETIALTPPLGWNSWNCWGPKITQERILDAARTMVSSGLSCHGWTYINIDDGWQGQRDASGALQPNEKFPDMPGLCNAIHDMGLKVGIYATPWTRSFGGYTGGSSGEPSPFVRELKNGWYVGQRTYEQEDARQWAQWGIDYLKYDWGPMDLPSGHRMREALRSCGRDIIYNATNSAPEQDFPEWVELAEAYYLWRRPQQGDGDIKDSWKSIASIGFRMHEWAKYVRPGHWNDPDMLVLGYVGWGEQQHACNLTPDEQLTHLTLWSLLAAPLLLGCDLTRLDAWTLSLLTNDEVLAINQDPLGRSANRISQQDLTEVWSKPLADGALAVGLFNRDEVERLVTIYRPDLQIAGEHSVRDLWRQRNLGKFSSSFQLPVAPHGAKFLKLTPVPA